MPVTPKVSAVFAHFQNLNLLALIHDLRMGRTARQAWAHGSVLCPVAHGLPTGSRVRDLQVFGYAGDLGQDCDFAARHVGADPAAVLRFVSAWDDGDITSYALLRQLDEVWEERLADAQAVQDVIGGCRPVTLTTVKDGDPYGEPPSDTDGPGLEEFH
jgi:hypothetical protein